MLQREFEKQIVANSSTVLTELNTLFGTADATASTTGFLENRTFGSLQSNTVGGLSKATYTTFNTQFVNAGGAFSGGPVGFMTDLYIECQNFSPMGTPNLILASPASYKLYKNALFEKERYMPEDTLDGGRLALAFAGAKMYVDPFMPAGSAANAVSMYFLNTAFMKLVIDSDATFSVGEFAHISG